MRCFRKTIIDEGNGSVFMQDVNTLLEVIKWCNENVGFATIVLSVLTL